MGIKVFLAEDHRIVREGLRTLLVQESDIEVVGEADSGRATVEAVLELSPDVVVMDAAMPDMNGIEATWRIHNQNEAIKILALSMYSDIRFVAQMLNSGASGYLPKDCASEELVQAIRTIFNGHTYLSPAITSLLVKDYIRRLGDSDVTPDDILTSRERETLQLLTEGKSTTEIADKLGLSNKTVEVHRHQVTQKLGIHSIPELVKYAVRHGLTPLEAGSRIGKSKGEQKCGRRF